MHKLNICSSGYLCTAKIQPFRVLYSLIFQDLFFYRKGMDTKNCILRTMCEVRHFLLPPGKSMLQDMFRVLFT